MEGGKVEGDNITINVQPVKSAAYEKGFDGHYPINIEKLDKKIDHLNKHEFEGIGVVYKGYVESKDKDYVAEVAVIIDEVFEEKILLPVSFSKRRPQIFHKYNLKKHKHTVQFKLLNPKINSTVFFQEAIIYSDTPHQVTY